MILLSAALLTVCTGNLFAQKKKTENDYNYKKAYEALTSEQDEEKALELVNKQLQETPDFVDALLLRIRLLREAGEYSAAMQDINHALKVNNPKKSGMANSTLYWWKAYIYQDMGDLKNAGTFFQKAYELARKDNKEHEQSIGLDYAQALYNLDDRDGADAIYQKLLAADESDLTAMVGLSRNLIDRERYDEALQWLDQCEKYNSNYAEIYRFKAVAYNKKGEITKAIDASLEWIKKNEDASLNVVMPVLVKNPNYAEAAIKALIKQGDDQSTWKILLSQLYERTHRYAEAVKVYNELESAMGPYSQINFRRSNCYAELGLYDQAIADITKGMEEEADWMDYCQRGDYYRYIGDIDTAISDFSAAIEDAPREDFPYYRRGWCYEMKGDRKKAMADYNVGIDLGGNYPYLYLMRGELFLLEGKKSAADADFGMILQKDTVARDRSCRMYALHFLGRDKEAEEWMDKMVASDPEDSETYYDKACLYARMGRLQESVAALRTAFEKGFRSFAHIRLDDDMDPIRNLPEFKALIEEYEALHATYLREYELSVPETIVPEFTRVTEVLMKRSAGGTFEIPCEINGLPLQMIFDTGASIVSISSLEATFMLKNGYLSSKDIKGTRYFSNADGSINPGTIITLREVKVGEAVLKNVEASVVRNQGAPLLLGQTVLERFGSITIDNQANKLIIKH